MFWIFYITHIIEIDLESSILNTSPSIRLGIISETDETIIIIWMEVGRVPWNFELSEDFWARTARKIDNKKWINLLKCYEVKSLSDKTC